MGRILERCLTKPWLKLKQYLANCRSCLKCKLLHKLSCTKLYYSRALGLWVLFNITFQGGLKSVLWTDTLQTFIMVAGMLVLVTKGMMDTGGISQVMTVASIGKRLDMTE